MTAWTDLHEKVRALQIENERLEKERVEARADLEQLACALQDAREMRERIVRERDEARAEVERLRAALRDALEGMADMRPYVWDHFAEKWGHDAYIARARASLGEKP